MSMIKFMSGYGASDRAKELENLQSLIQSTVLPQDGSRLTMLNRASAPIAAKENASAANNDAAKAFPFEVMLSQEGIERQKAAKLHEGLAAEASDFQIKQINTAHYSWTPEDGIVETVPEEQEAAQIAKFGNLFKNEFQQSIRDTIANIIKPYDTYEEAEKALYEKPQSPMKMIDNGNEQMMESRDYRVSGLCGRLGLQLNDYLKNYGADDEYLVQLDSALTSLSPRRGENALVDLVHDMVNRVRDGENINVHSEEFANEVKTAVNTFFESLGTSDEEPQNKKLKDAKPEDRNKLSYDDMARYAAKEDKELLDKLLGRKNDDAPAHERVGDVLKNSVTGVK